MEKVLDVNVYLKDFIDYLTISCSHDEIAVVIKDILHCNPVEGLDKYPREILALAMEKLMVKSIEYSRNDSSYWAHFIVNAPLLYNSNNNLCEYINLFLFNRNKINTDDEVIKEIDDFYNQAIISTSKLKRNKMVTLVNDKKVCLSDIMFTINDALNLPISIKDYKTRKLLRLAKNDLVGIASILGLVTSISFINIDSREVNAQEYNPTELTTMTPDLSYHYNEFNYSYNAFNYTYDGEDEEELVEVVKNEFSDNYENALENPDLGFEITSDNQTYELTEEEKKLLCAVVAAESDKTYDDALAVVSSILNRCETEKWINAHGTNPIDQITADGQYSAYLEGYYEKYLEDCPLEVIEAVEDALNGIRNNNYLSFRSNDTVDYSDNMISLTGNRYKGLKK